MRCGDTATALEAACRTRCLQTVLATLIGADGDRMGCVRAPLQTASSGRHEGRAMVPLRANVSYNVARLMPKVRHTAALLIPLSSATAILAHCSSLTARGRPPRLPRRMAAAIPARTR